MMTTESTPGSLAARILVRGIHLDLTPALQQAAWHKAEHLLRHEDRIVRIRLDLELDRTRGAQDVFLAKGRIEIRGPDLIAQVHSEDAYKSLDLLVDKLDELLRRRHQKRIKTRNDRQRQAPKGATGDH
jgi:putative sigma-54 modulation protein